MAKPVWCRCAHQIKGATLTARCLRNGLIPPQAPAQSWNLYGNSGSLRQKTQCSQIWVEETEGFEPSIPVTKYGSLAGNWFQPLTHVSAHTALFGCEPRAIVGLAMPGKGRFYRHSASPGPFTRQSSCPGQPSLRLRPLSTRLIAFSIRFAAEPLSQRDRRTLFRCARLRPQQFQGFAVKGV